MSSANHCDGICSLADRYKNMDASPADATPKLIDIRFAVLAMELAILAASSVISAEVSVLMLVNCNEVHVPYENASRTITQTGL